MPPAVTLLPLQHAQQTHIGLLQAVYRSAPLYWAMYELPGAPLGQAERDLEASTSTPGRNIVGIVMPLAVEGASDSVGMVGAVDFRLHYPAEHTATIGMIMVAEPYQRSGIARAAWHVLAPWLSEQAGMRTVRAGIEQFNIPGLRFFEAVGFMLTGESLRHQVGDRLVRLLYLEQMLGAAA